MLDAPEIETLILANHVEAVNGLLYISGGGWADHWRPVPPGAAAPAPSHLGIAVSVIVPWNSTNTPHQVQIWIEDQDGHRLNDPVQVTMNTGRPPNIPPGSEQRVSLALAVNLVFPHPGDYCVKARLGGQEARSVAFRVHDLPAQGPLPPPAPPT
ncbi:MAG TPA: hypothetical protein VMW49_08315 [Candidatus Dormibacteraeota bacterium]|nr:hypothetical protein [Candidatus Dormibacteraeota bacterium]